MEGYTVTELVELMKKLKRPMKKGAIRQAIHIAGIKPLVSEFIYPLETLEILKNAPCRGRPKKKPD